ncbi:MAG: aspartate-semialdehyde dehydrogenase [Fimbriimonadaceae bacterium]|nr:aspartate-semialdehyde dehydrogenase [Fimbriimonadaceae bacterium]
MKGKIDVAIYGATGAVGQELITSLVARRFPFASLRLYASPASVGKLVKCGESSLRVESSEDSTWGCDLAFMSAGASKSREFAPKVVGAGGVVIDNSSAFRMDESVPLVVPEINGNTLSPTNRLVANPNCIAAITMMAVHPLRQLGTISRLVLSTYQSASGGGAKLMDDLQEQTRTVLNGGVASSSVAPHPYAFNLFSHNTPINEHGYNDEEWKVIAESRKILDMPDLAIGVTCIRVPVLRAHSISLTVEFEGEVPAEGAVREVLMAAPGVRVVDDRQSNHFPMPSEASGQGDVLVGRIRRDLSHRSAINLFVVGDQLLKGAALNAVQIAELMLARNLI